MRVDSTLNSMSHLENQLNESATNISKVTVTDDVEKLQENNSLSNYVDPKIDLTKEMIEQVMIPIAYTANAEVISTQSSITKTLLDIKA